MQLRIVLADDHTLVRQGVRGLLERGIDCLVVGEAADGRTALALASSLQPDVLITDLAMPELSGIELIRQLRAQAPHTALVALSMHAEEALVREALRAGVMAYVLKDANVSELIHAVAEVAAGRRYLSPALSARAIAAYARDVAPATLDLYETLTPREREVLMLAAEGRTAAQIALDLGLSARTVETYRASMLRKLGLHSQTELVRYALRRGLITE